MKNNSNGFEIIAKLPDTLKKRKKYVLATCPILDVHSQAETEKSESKPAIGVNLVPDLLY